MKTFAPAILFVLLTGIPESLDGQGLFEVPPMSAEGRPVEKMELYVIGADSTRMVTGQEFQDFISRFNLQNKDIFSQTIYDLKSKKMLGLNEIQDVEYKTYIAQVSGPITVRWYITAGERETKIQNEGLLNTGNFRDLPVLAENRKAKLQIFLNGGLGGFVDNNAFFGEGEEFTEGNPVADKPADGGVTAWSEFFLEPGIGGITGIGKTDFYVYGALSGLFSARMGSDIYSEGSTSFFDIERAYAGFLWARIGKNDHLKLDVSAGRNFFQLNDGFLFSRFSGSSNAGDRGSVYLSSRTTFQKTVIATLSSRYWTFTGFFLEPQELFKDRQTNINYTGFTAGFNDNRTIDANLSVINRTNGLGAYSLPNDETLTKKGLWIINPKLWLTNIAETGVFFKSEYAFEFKDGMQANGWYMGAGIKKSEWKFRPQIYYRFAFMQGDDPGTETYERFDPILTGGLGSWVQGLNYRKVIGTGNIVSHRIELSSRISKKLLVLADAFFLMADQLNNLGGLAPISSLQSKNFGQEYTLNFHYNINAQFLLLGVFSFAFPGDAITDNLPDGKSWQTYQLSLFMFL